MIERFQCEKVYEAQRREREKQCDWKYTLLVQSTPEVFIEGIFYVYDYMRANYLGQGMNVYDQILETI